jgi:homogentisate 1,2-dioxygenase
MIVRPGELVVIQRGMRFKVRLPDGPVRGCRSHKGVLRLHVLTN